MLGEVLGILEISYKEGVDNSGPPWMTTMMNNVIGIATIFVVPLFLYSPNHKSCLEELQEITWEMTLSQVIPKHRAPMTLLGIIGPFYLSLTI